MPYKDKEKRLLASRDSKRRARLQRGALPRGKYIRAPRSEEEILLSKQRNLKRLRVWRAMYSDLKQEKKLLWAATRRAKQKGMECSIVESDIVLPKVCPYLGTPLVPSARRGSDRRNVFSLDRVDSTKGYTKDNIEVISQLANTMKSNASREDLLNFAREILKRYGP